MAQYRRTIFLINKRFQLRFSLYVCSWLLALSFVYPLIVYNVFDYFIRYAAADPQGPSVQLLVDTRHQIILLLIGLQVVFLLITFLISVFMSHRIAGPLYKLSLFFKKAKEGNLEEALFFRDKDHFHELAAEYNEMIQALREKIATDPAKIQAARAFLEQNPPQTDRALATLRELQK
jgi:sensor histidine kinase YesM